MRHFSCGWNMVFLFRFYAAVAAAASQKVNTIMHTYFIIYCYDTCDTQSFVKGDLVMQL